MAEILVSCDVEDVNVRLPRVYKTENSVVRPDEKMFSSFDNDCAPRRSNAGINHHDVNRPGRKIVVARAEDESR